MKTKITFDLKTIHTMFFRQSNSQSMFLKIGIQASPNLIADQTIRKTRNVATFVFMLSDGGQRKCRIRAFRFADIASLRLKAYRAANAPENVLNLELCKAFANAVINECHGGN